MAKELKRTKKKVYLPCGNFKLSALFMNKGYIVDTSDYGQYDSDLIVFSGGEDVCPLLYGEKALQNTFFSLNRDIADNNLYRSLDGSVPKLGICRGAQFLNVMNGGTLNQDVNNHTSNHKVIDHETGELIHVSSTHHQMMCPSFGERVEVIASAKEATFKDGHGYSSKKKDGNWPEWHDPEVIYYQDTNSLCVQFHPEYMHKQSKCVEYFWSIVERTLGDSVIQGG